MTDQTPKDSSVSITAQVSPDALGLGPTSGQRTAEMVAGLRYELKKTPLHNALSRMTGRLVARMMSSLLRDKSQLNYILARPATFNHLVRQYIAAKSEKGTLVEIAAGFSPRGYELALEMPQLQVIEIDLPDVIEEKQRRLNKAQMKIPANMKWYKADLGVRALADVLGGEKVDIVSAEGLNPYFPHEAITRIASRIRESLKPGGIYISDVGWTIKQDSNNEASVGMFRRNASNFLGIIKSEEEGQQLFLDAGYSPVDVYRPTKVTATMPDIPTVPQDYSVIFIAHNPDSPVTASTAAAAPEVAAKSEPKPEAESAAKSEPKPDVKSDTDKPL